MIEFNEDGSIKLPDSFQKKKENDEKRMKTSRCIKVRKEVVSDRTPKKCVLRITLSDGISDNRFVENIFNYFNQQAEVPAKIKKLNEKEFEVEIGTCFRRCSDCTSLVGRYRQHLDGNLIEEKAECPYRPNNNFAYEDYFD